MPQRISAHRTKQSGPVTHDSPSTRDSLHGFSFARNSARAGLSVVPMDIKRLPANMHDKITIRPDGCWEWTGALNSKGYGCAALGGASSLTHRAAYEALAGPIPEGLQIDHLCRFVRCCNPAHLEPVTQKVNQERKASTHKSHCKHGHPMNAENTIVKRRPNGLVQWNCRECERAAQRRRRAQRAC